MQRSVISVDHKRLNSRSISSGLRQLRRAMVAAVCLSLSPLGHGAPEADFERKDIELDVSRLQQRVEDAAGKGESDKMSTLLAQKHPNADMRAVNLGKAMAVAAKNGKYRMIDLLLAHGAAIDADESAALRAAIEDNNEEMVKYLLTQGAKVDPPAKSGENYDGVIRQSPLGAAVSWRNEKLVRLLIERGANVNLEQSEPPLVTAVRERDPAIVDLLLKAGADPNGAKRAEDMSPLMMLAASSQNVCNCGASDTAVTSIARRLVATGADVDYITRDCSTAYHVASQQGSAQMKPLLVELGADPSLHLRCDEVAWRDEQSAEVKTRNTLRTDIDSYLRAGDYRNLETLYRTLSDGQQRTPSGALKLTLFYEHLRSGTYSASAWVDLQENAGAWIKAYPQSPAARIFHAYLHLQRSFSLRSDKPYDQLPFEYQREIETASSKALKTLKEAKEVAAKAKDPEWYRAMLTTLQYANRQHSIVATTSYLNEGRALYPEYYGTYFAAAENFHRTGAPNAVEKTARSALSSSSLEEQRSLYARVYWFMDQKVYKGRIFERSPADWPTMRLSFDDIIKHHPDPHNFNAYAYFACMARDHKTMNDMLKRMGKQVAVEAWGDGGAASYVRCVKRAGG
jgi:ankyrin repeat protein